MVRIKSSDCVSARSLTDFLDPKLVGAAEMENAAASRLNDEVSRLTENPGEWNSIIHYGVESQGALRPFCLTDETLRYGDRMHS